MNRAKWALIVGACAYDYHPSLKYSATDATRFARALETRLGAVAISAIAEPAAG